MHRRIAVTALFTISSLLLVACTQQAWFEGLRERERQQCYDNPSQAEVEHCLDRVNATTYEDYERDRKKPATQERK